MPVDSSSSCPKHMTYGPCGGVGFDGSCEIDAATRCAFVDIDTVRWRRPPAPTVVQSPSAGSERVRALLGERPLVVADFPARAVDARSLEECVAAMAGPVDAVLSGDAGPARVQFAPSYRARLIADADMLPFIGLNCRDRNRVALEGELAGLAHAGAGVVHCITGDHTHTGSRPDAMPVFDLDATELTALARAAGHLVSVAESPTTPPVDRRAARLREKEKAGAELCFVNHCGGAEPVARFIAQARMLGSTSGFLPCVPVVLDEGSAHLLRTFTTLVLPPGYLESILSAADPREAGIAAAVSLSLAMLQIEGVVGVDLSGGAAPGRETEHAQSLAEIAHRLKEEL
ncbi:methylenetetrahydrofolate reductase C-terminal domain-containing protein [uncultured Microbacterium sp.]|uniref:methylenetetrahydrofolate reductase C-terminal domain-containing protein n=1 Tax=uncultured Microbacterium sp. TaxID=191216 RepID=UPI0026217E98|nr:methylenetetrahydrofolate reductase C-terminal domain-containing protein [uncultured Microbacterium sp.]